MSDKYAALKQAAQEEIMCRESGDTSDAWQDEASPEFILELLAERDADKARIAELEARTLTVKLPQRASAEKYVDETFDNNDLAAIYNACRLECEVKIKDACAAAGISLKIEGE